MADGRNLPSEEEIQQRIERCERLLEQRVARYENSIAAWRERVGWATLVLFLLAGLIGIAMSMLLALQPLRNDLKLTLRAWERVEQDKRGAIVRGIDTLPAAELILDENRGSPALRVLGASPDPEMIRIGHLDDLDRSYLEVVDRQGQVLFSIEQMGDNPPTIHGVEAIVPRKRNADDQ